jgi:hypothetical protein
MDKRNGLVYDSQKYFSRFLKYEFKETFSFDTYTDFKSFDNGLKKYSLIVFVIYSYEELLDFMSVYKKGIPIIVCTFNNKMMLEFGKIEEILLLDTSNVKSEIVIELKSYFNVLNNTDIE